MTSRASFARDGGVFFKRRHVPAQQRVDRRAQFVVQLHRGFQRQDAALRVIVRRHFDEDQAVSGFAVQDAGIEHIGSLRRFGSSAHALPHQLNYQDDARLSGVQRSRACAKWAKCSQNFTRADCLPEQTGNVTSGVAHA
jgi:hypothetical protein